jgi:hypothetical protein
VTPAGTVSTPPLNVTPLLKLGVVLKSVPAVAVVPVRLNAKFVGVLDALLSVTVCVMLPPSVALAAVTLLMVGAASLSMMVPMPVASEMAALLAPLNVTLKVSLPSNTVSLVIGTVMVCVVCPGVKVSVPLVAV